MVENVLGGNVYARARQLMQEDAKEKAFADRKDIAMPDGTYLGRDVCNDGRIIQEILSLLDSGIKSLLPSFKAELVVSSVIYWSGPKKPLQAHLDSTGKGKKGMVVVFSQGAEAVLSVSQVPGDIQLPIWAKVLIPENSLYILRGHEYLHMIEAFGQRASLILVLKTDRAWPQDSSNEEAKLWVRN